MEPLPPLNPGAGPDISGFFPYSDAVEQAMHQFQIACLAEEMSMPEYEIAPLYENILSGMKGSARIHDYLPVLVSKNVKKLLKGRY